MLNIMFPELILPLIPIGLKIKLTSELLEERIRVYNSIWVYYQDIIIIFDNLMQTWKDFRKHDNANIS